MSAHAETVAPAPAPHSEQVKSEPGTSQVSADQASTTQEKPTTTEQSVADSAQKQAKSSNPANEDDVQIVNVYQHSQFVQILGRLKAYDGKLQPTQESLLDIQNNGEGDYYINDEDIDGYFGDGEYESLPCPIQNRGGFSILMATGAVANATTNFMDLGLKFWSAVSDPFEVLHFTVERLIVQAELGPAFHHFDHIIEVVELAGIIFLHGRVIDVRAEPVNQIIVIL
ncbi:hypothetical protein [Limosilactobacillus caecicola]|uniref:hypothetical protein n=1 Tax=Limosilactobacillus caecicola TaxID=2941332 RepID=UPI0038996C5F